jgi:hypothetical protein
MGGIAAPTVAWMMASSRMDDPAAMREKLAAYREMLAHVRDPDDRRVIRSLIGNLEKQLADIARRTAH